MKTAVSGRRIIQGTAAALAAVSLGSMIDHATAEDTGRWEVLLASGPSFRAVAPAPGFRVVVPVAPLAPRPQIVSLPTPSAIPAVPPDPNKRENPLQSILRDPTLRYGDVVVFPDGPRVFKGEPGGRHSLRDFAAVAGSRDLPTSSRRTLLAMPIGENSAWSSNVNLRANKVASSSSDVETTGSLGRGLGKTVTVRTGRGDVRVIRVAD